MEHVQDGALHINDTLYLSDMYETNIMPKAMPVGDGVGKVGDGVGKVGDGAEQ